jgi:DNA-binding SARP family transcriptional activator/pimeloyl-ACP methyl ester carboxylesterase
VTATVNLLGPFRVEVDGRLVPDEAWSRRDAASLVKVLALAPEHQLHRERAMDALWPDLAPADAVPRLHKAAHYARKALGRADAVVLRGDLVLLLPGYPTDVDAETFEAAAAAALEGGTPAAAEEVLDRHPGEPLPVDLYSDWAAPHRDRLAALRHRLLRQAGRWHELVELDPTDEEAHLEIMRRLVRDGDRRGALHQYDQLDRALQRELGTTPGPEASALRSRLLAELRRLGGMSRAEEGRLEQQIRFCRTEDGVTLAYACSGEGPPLVKAANWLTHLDHDWNSPVWRHWLVELSRRHRLVRYDERGCGLSDWDVKPPSLDAWVRDFEAVVDSAGLDRFPVLGISQGGAVAVRYAVQNPGRVTKLVIYGAYAQGRLARATSEEDRRMHALQVELARLGWGRDDPTLRQVFTAQMMPGGSQELWAAFNELQRQTATAEHAAQVMDMTGDIDVCEEARQVRVPTLVLHAKNDSRLPFAQGRLLASLIPDSRFVALDSANHVLLADEPAWPHFLAEVEAFLAE